MMTAERREYNRAYYAANRERELERGHAWKAAHREEARRYSAAYAAAHPDRPVNPETGRASSHRYYWRHRDEIAVKRHDPSEMARMRVAQADQRLRRPEQIAARNAVNHAIERGELRREPCVVCGIEPTHAHHHLGYEPENRLDVLWLCTLHHGAAHRAMRRTVAA